MPGEWLWSRFWGNLGPELALCNFRQKLRAEATGQDKERESLRKAEQK